MNENIKAILFDVGGTLRFTQPEEGRAASVMEEMRRLLDFSGSWEELKIQLSHGEKAYRRWCKKSLVELPEEDLWCRFMFPAPEKMDFVKTHAIQLNQLWRGAKGPKHLLPHAVETLKELAARGYRLCIISNTTSSVEVPELVRENQLEQVISPVILSAVYGRRKPHPSLFLDAARQLNVHPDQCAYVGDRPSRDVIGAREAGFGCVVIIQAKGLKHEKTDVIPMRPDSLITRLPELLELFPKRNGTAPLKRRQRQPDYLYDAALSTMWNVGQKMEFNQSFAAGRMMGFARFELNHGVSPALFDQIDLNTYRVGNVHDPCPAVHNLNELKDRDWTISALDDENRQQGVEITKKTIDLAVRLGANSVIVHPGQVSGDRSMDRQLRALFEKGGLGTPEYEELKQKMIADRQARSGAHVDAVVKSLREIAEYAHRAKMSVGLENRYRYYDIPLPEELDRFLEVCHEPWFGFQYDVGHAQALDRLGICSHEGWLQRFGHRIVGVHLHDVKGLQDHQAPGLGDVDFNMVARYLPEYAFRTLEVGDWNTQSEILQGMETLVARGCVKRI